MNITLRQLAHFRAAARAGSISAAAEREHVSRSSIAAAIDDLERVLGTTLCVRTKASGIELTRQGERVLAQAADLLARAEEIEGVGRGDQPRGALTVGCFPSLAPTVMAAAWAVMAKRYPEVTLHVVSLGKAEIVDGVLSGQLDVGLAYNLQVHPDLRTTAIYDTEMHAIISADSPFASMRVARAADLVDQPLILMDVSPGVEDTMAYFDAAGLTPRVLTRTSNFEFIRSLVARDLGYSLFIQRPRNRMSYEGRPIVMRRLDPRPHRETAMLARRADREPGPAAAALERVVLELAPELAPFDADDG